MDRLLTVKEAARQLSVTTAFLYLQIESGLISHVRVGNRAIRLEQKELDDYITRGRHPTNKRTARLLGRVSR